MIDVLFAVTEVAAVGEVIGFLAPATCENDRSDKSVCGLCVTFRVVEFEWPEEVRRLLEVVSHGEDFVHEIFQADDVLLAERLLDDAVVRERNALLVGFAEAALVHELAHGLQVRVAPGDVRLGNAQHLDGGFVEFDEHAVVDLTQTKESQHLLDTWVHTADTRQRSSSKTTGGGARRTRGCG